MQNVRIVHGGGDSYVEVHGVDNLIKLDRITPGKVWAGVTAADVVTQICTPYQLTADCDPTPGSYTVDNLELLQIDTDLQLIQRLGRKFGCHVWLATDPMGVQKLMFKRPVLTGPAAATLQMNQGTATHPQITWLDLSWNCEAQSKAEAADLDVLNREKIDGKVEKQPLPLLGKVELASFAPSPRVGVVRSPALDAGQLKARTEAALIDASWFTRARCRTSFQALGTVIRPHTLVDLGGLGTRHSGTYFVAGVRHVIDDQQHLMELDLRRNAWSA
jgi:hypothetical protein